MILNPSKQIYREELAKKYLSLNNMRIILIGGSGFVGSRLFNDEI